ncbi:MAG: EAL domain-containing protein [Gammaproteobacteria bacterium]|nr:EAL domain-containing protein [Gammaproteobacteria bacterium]
MPKKESAELKHEVDALKSEVKRLESKLAVSSAAFLSIVGKSLDGIVIIDGERMVVYANYAAMELFDKNIADLLGEPLEIKIDMTRLENQEKGANEVVIIRSDGSEITAEISILSADWNNSPSHVVSFRDITERKKTEQLLEYMAEHDVITDLPNRIFFEKRMSKAINEAKDAEEHMAILYLDIDDFKIVNDTLGHQAGDELLKSVSDILKQSIRKRDTVARLGGDEFAIVLTNLRKSEYAGVVAQNIINKLDKPFIYNAKEIYINLSIGIAVYPIGGISAVDLIKHADMAMYSAKRNGKNQYRFHSEKLNRESERSLQISNGLRNAILKNEFFMMYQPIIDLKTGGCSGIEALLRWKHPQLGILYPEAFLAVAEKLNLMSAIGGWVTKKVFFDFKQFNTHLLLFFSVNITANELSETKTIKNILKSIKGLDVDIDKLIFEITETSFVTNPERLIKKLDNLFDVRIQLAIDDYGTGYSSLSYLKRLPVSILKIDQSFVQDMEQTPNAAVILESTIKLAHDLGIKVIAEGVETETQLQFLEKNACDYVQGYYFSKPLSLQDTVKFIEDSHKK